MSLHPGDPGTEPRELRAAAADDGELRAAWLMVRHAGAALRRRWLAALLIAGLAAAAIVLRLALRDDRYEARGLLQVGLMVDVGAADDDRRLAGTATRAFNSQVELLKSERVLTEAMFEADGQVIPPGNARDVALREYLSRVQIRPLRDTFLVEVEGWDREPARASKRVNALFDVYVRISNEHLGERYRLQSDLGRRREVEAAEALRQAETRREDFLARWGEISFEARGNATAVRSGELEARAARVDVERATVAAESSLVAANLDPERLDAPEVMLGRLGLLLQAKEVLEPVHEARSELARAEAGLEPTHPAVRLMREELAAQLQAARAGLRALSEGRQEELRHHASRLQSEQAEVARLLEDLERERFRLTELQADHERLQREVAYYERELEATRGSQWAAEGRSRVQVAAAVLARAEEPREPASPFSPVRLLLIALGSLLLGAASVVVWDRIDDTIRTDDDLGSSLRLPVLAKIPVHDPRSGELAQLVATASDAQGSATGEAFRLLRTNVLHTLGAPERPTLLITSGVSHEGKTLCAAQLAAVMARTDGPVLLIEADLRRPRLAQLLEVEAPAGVSQVLLGRCDLADAVVPTTLAGLSLLAAGPSPASSPSDLLTAGSVASLLEAARRQFRAVVIDGPPALGIADASLLAPHVNGVLVVVRVARARRRDVEACLAQLRAVDARLAGLVLNGHHELLAYLPYGAPTRAAPAGLDEPAVEKGGAPK